MTQAEVTARLIAYGLTGRALERVKQCNSLRALKITEKHERGCLGRSAVMRAIAERIEKLEYYRRGT